MMMINEAFGWYLYGNTSEHDVYCRFQYTFVITGLNQRAIRKWCEEHIKGYYLIEDEYGFRTRGQRFSVLKERHEAAQKAGKIPWTKKSNELLISFQTFDDAMLFRLAF